MLRLRFAGPLLAFAAVFLMGVVGLIEMQTYNGHCAPPIGEGPSDALAADRQSVVFSLGELAAWFVALALPSIVLTSKLARIVSASMKALLLVTVLRRLSNVFDAHDCFSGGSVRYPDEENVLIVVVGAIVVASGAVICIVDLAVLLPRFVKAALRGRVRGGER